MQQGPSFNQYLALLENTYNQRGIKEVISLIERNPDVIYWIYSKKSSALITLIWACDNGYVELVKELLTLPEIYYVKLGGLSVFLNAEGYHTNVLAFLMYIGEVTPKNKDEIVNFALNRQEFKRSLKALYEKAAPPEDDELDFELMQGFPWIVPKYKTTIASMRSDTAQTLTESDSEVSEGFLQRFRKLWC